MSLWARGGVDNDRVLLDVFLGWVRWQVNDELNWRLNSALAYACPPSASQATTTRLGNGYLAPGIGWKRFCLFTRDLN